MFLDKFDAGKLRWLRQAIVDASVNSASNPALQDSTDDPNLLRVAVVGPPRVYGPGDREIRLPRKNLAMLCYLACRSDTPVPRETLKRLFWPDSGDDQANASLRQALSHIRKVLGPDADVVLSDKNTIHLDARRIRVDLPVLLKMLESTELQTLEAGIDLYRGELLEGLGSVTPEFDRWMEAERSSLSSAVTKALGQLARAYEGADRLQDALGIYRRMILEDPLQEDVHRRIMAAEISLNHFDLALRQFQKLEAILLKELGVRPDPESIALAKRARTRRSNVRNEVDHGTPEIPLSSKTADAAISRDHAQKPRVIVQQFGSGSDDAASIGDALREGLVSVFSRQTGLETVGDSEESDFVISGSITELSAAGSWRIRCAMTETREGRVVWAEHLDEDAGSLAMIIDRTVTRFAGAVRIRIPELLFHGLPGRPIEQMSVDDLLNYAMHCNFMATRAGWSDAERALRRVLVLDPDNWMACTMLCFNLIGQSRIFGWKPMAATQIDEGRKLIDLARRLAPRSETVRFVHGSFLFYAKDDPDGALLEADTAYGLNPDYFHTIDLLSQVNLRLGNSDKARVWIDRLMTCDPGYPYRHLYLRSAALLYLSENAVEDALVMFRQAEFAAADLPQNLIGIALCASTLDAEPLLEETLAELRSIAPDFDPALCSDWPFPTLQIWTKAKSALVRS